MSDCTEGKCTSCGVGIESPGECPTCAEITAALWETWTWDNVMIVGESTRHVSDEKFRVAAAMMELVTCHRTFVNDSVDLVVATGIDDEDIWPTRDRLVAEVGGWLAPEKWDSWFLAALVIASQEKHCWDTHMVRVEPDMYVVSDIVELFIDVVKPAVERGVTAEQVCGDFTRDAAFLWLDADL